MNIIGMVVVAVVLVGCVGVSASLITLCVVERPRRGGG